MEVVLGLGSNLGDRLGLLRGAVDRLEHPPGRAVELVVLGRSHVVESPPAGGPPQGDYLNAAALCRTSLGPVALLDFAHEVERALGRTRPAPRRWDARPIDIDLLWIRGLSVDLPDLCVPHPRLRERAFALGPLLEVAPDAVDPRDGVPYRTLGAALGTLPRIARL